VSVLLVVRVAAVFRAVVAALAAVVDLTVAVVIDFWHDDFLGA